MVDEIRHDPPPADDPGSPPEERRMRVRYLADLFAKPRVFFTRGVDLGAGAWLLPVIWANGIASAISRLDVELLRHDMGAERAAWRIFEPIISGPWTYYWLWVLGVGIVSGALIYAIGGWWYGVRLRFSGAPADVDRSLGRRIYVYAGLVYALPTILASVLYMPFFDSYVEGYRSDEYLSGFLVLFPFWAVAVSYVGVTSCFTLKKWPARIWFLILPAIFYVAVLGLVLALFAFFSEGF